MGTTTANLGLYKPAFGETGWDGQVNANFDVIDSYLSALTKGTGSPEASLAAPVGTVYQRTDGAAGTVLYMKESGIGNTGWIPYSADIWIGFTIDGTLTVGTNDKQIPIPANCTFISLSARLATAPTGASVTLDVLRSGSTLYNTKPTIASGAQFIGNAPTLISTPTLTTAQYLQIGVTTIGSTFAGANMAGVIVLRRR